MADARQFEKFIPPWQAWVEQRRSIWSHLHLSGLLLGEGDNWICVSLAMLLAEDAACRSPNGINPSWKGEVCAFRVAVPIAMLDALLAGLEAGEWPDSVIPGVPGRIRFNPVEGKRLEPSGEPRLESPNRGVDVIRPELRWPRYAVELTGPQLQEWCGQTRYPEIESLDRRLTGKGNPGLAELASLFGILDGGSGHVGDIWNRSTTVRLVAPALCRIDSAAWSEASGSFIASIEVGNLVPRDQVKVLLYDPHTLGLRDPVPVGNSPKSSIVVDLGKDKPSDRLEVRLLFFEEVLQKERGGTGMLSASGRFTPVVTSGLIAEPDEGAGPGGWIRIRPLAPGGQANLSVAKRDGQLGALKEIRADRSDAARLTRLRREIGFLRRFKDLPFLLQIVDSSPEDDDVPYLVTELAPLGSAEDRKGSFKGDVWRVLRLARDMASALRGLHAEDVIHRDTKPKNIFLFSRNEAVLGDLGVAYDAGKTGVTSFAEPVDSGWFSPPEHERPGRPEAAYDTFMLGKTIYYLLTGGHKYRGDDFAHPEWSVSRIIGEASAPPLNDLLGQLVAPLAKDRLPSMERVIRAIDDTIRAVFGGADRAGRCTACGKSNYIPAGPLNLTQAHLFLNLPSGSQLHLGDRHINLFVCPQCGSCAFQITDQDRRTLAE